MSGLTTIRACYADPLLYRNFRRELDADAAAVQHASQKEQWLFFCSECVAGMVLSLTGVGIASLRNTDNLLPKQASFLLLNTVFANVIIYLFVTHHIELVNLASYVARFATESYTRGCHWFRYLLDSSEQARDQWHSSRVSTASYRYHCKLCPNTEGIGGGWWLQHLAVKWKQMQVLAPPLRKKEELQTGAVVNFRVALVQVLVVVKVRAVARKDAPLSCSM